MKFQFCVSPVSLAQCVTFEEFTWYSELNDQFSLSTWQNTVVFVAEYIPNKPPLCSFYAIYLSCRLEKIVRNAETSSMPHTIHAFHFDICSCMYILHLHEKLLSVETIYAAFFIGILKYYIRTLLILFNVHKEIGSINMGETK